MNAPARPPSHADALQRQVRHELHGRLALLSAAIWAVGTLVLFLVYAAGNPRPVPMALMAMLVPLVPAVLPWLFFGLLVDRLATRRIREAAARR